MYDLSPHRLESARKWNDEGGTVGYVGIEDEGPGIVAMFCVTDTVRDEAQQVVSALIDGGVKVVMLTGDGEGAALAAGEEIGLPNSSVQSRLLPEDKLHYVSGLKDCSSRRSVFFRDQRNVVVFVGDGVNDAASLAVADVGVAMGHGAALVGTSSTAASCLCVSLNVHSLNSCITVGTGNERRNAHGLRSFQPVIQHENGHKSHCHRQRKYHL
jgi:Cd2+/Zn2+-exporting ATPase